MSWRKCSSRVIWLSPYRAHSLRSSERAPPFGRGGAQQARQREPTPSQGADAQEVAPVASTAVLKEREPQPSPCSGLPRVYRNRESRSSAEEGPIQSPG